MQNDVSGCAVLALTAHVSADLCRGIDADAFGEGMGTGFFGGMLHGNDGVCALGDSLTDQGLAVFIAGVLAGRQVVVVLDAALIAVALNSFPAALVEAFIVQQ